MNPLEINILGMGSLLIDKVIPISEEFMQTIPGKKGGMELISSNDLQSILKNAPQIVEISPGGSSCNTLRALARLGRNCVFFGKIGKDSDGKQLLEALFAIGMTPQCPQGSLPTGQALCLVTPDKERTLRTYLGASSELTVNDIEPDLFRGISHLHLEGYLLLHPEIPEKAMELAKKNGCTISLDLASFEIVNTFKKRLVGLISKYVDVLFANQHECAVLTGMNPEKGCAFLKDICRIAVVTQGKKGCVVGHHDQVITVNARSVNVLDTTGAGDLFSAGFLHGFLQGKPLEECARWGCMLGAEIVQVYGADLPGLNAKYFDV